MKEVWWKYLVDNKKYWAHGFTLSRLNKVKQAVFNDQDIMWDLLTRHDGANLNPDDMKKDSMDNYNHCIGNFSCNVLYKMMELKIYKPKK